MGFTPEDFAAELLHTDTLEGEDFLELGIVLCWVANLFEPVEMVFRWGGVFLRVDMVPS